MADAGPDGRSAVWLRAGSASFPASSATPWSSLLSDAHVILSPLSEERPDGLQGPGRAKDSHRQGSGGTHQHSAGMLSVSPHLPPSQRSWKSGILGKILIANSSCVWPALQAGFSTGVTSGPPLFWGCHPSQVPAPVSPWPTPQSPSQVTPSLVRSPPPSAADGSFPALYADCTHSQLAFSVFQSSSFSVTGL